MRFEVLEPRTPSKRMRLERARCVELCHISSGWFKHLKPHRTPSKRMILKRARCVELCHISSGWFKHIEPHRTPSKRMLLERAKCVALSYKFGVVQAPRTSSNPLKLHDRARCVEFCHRSLGWFKHNEPHRTPQNTGVQLERGV